MMAKRILQEYTHVMATCCLYMGPISPDNSSPLSELDPTTEPGGNWSMDLNSEPSLMMTAWEGSRAQRWLQGGNPVAALLAQMNKPMGLAGQQIHL